MNVEANIFVFSARAERIGIEHISNEFMRSMLMFKNYVSNRGSATLLFPFLLNELYPGSPQTNQTIEFRFHQLNHNDILMALKHFYH